MPRQDFTGAFTNSVAQNYNAAMNRYKNDIAQEKLPDGPYHIQYTKVYEHMSKKGDAFLVVVRTVIDGGHKGSEHKQWIRATSDFMVGKHIETLAMHYGRVPDDAEELMNMSKDLVENKAMERIRLETTELDEDDLKAGLKPYQGLEVEAVLEASEEEVVKEEPTKAEKIIEEVGTDGIDESLPVKEEKETPPAETVEEKPKKTRKKRTRKAKKEVETTEVTKEEPKITALDLYNKVYEVIGTVSAECSKKDWDIKNEADKKEFIDNFYFTTDEITEALVDFAPAEKAVKLWSETTGLASCINDDEE